MPTSYDHFVTAFNDPRLYLSKTKPKPGRPGSPKVMSDIQSSHAQNEAAYRANVLREQAARARARARRSKPGPRPPARRGP